MLLRKGWQRFSQNKNLHQNFSTRFFLLQKFLKNFLMFSKKFPREKLAENFSLRFLKIYKRLNLKNFSFFI